MEDKLKILKVEYLSNQLLDHSQILILSLDQIMFCQSFKWRLHPMEDGMNIESGISQQPFIGSYSKQGVKIFQMKTTSQQPQNI